MPEELQVVASGYRWTGYGIRTFASTIAELIRSAKNELAMTIYIINDLKTVEYIKGALERGVLVEIFIYLPDPSSAGGATREIIKLKERYDNLKVYEISEEVVHAKVIIADGERVLVGSANPTFGGLYQNYEIGLLLRDVQIAQRLILLLRKLRER